MTQTNVGPTDRIARAVAVLALAAIATFLPMSIPLRIGVGATALYLLVTAIAGSCLGYLVMGRSTCPTRARP